MGAYLECWSISVIILLISPLRVSVTLDVFCFLAFSITNVTIFPVQSMCLVNYTMTLFTHFPTLEKIY